MQQICEAEISANAVEIRIDAEQRHHLTLVVNRFFQTRESLILIAKSQMNDRVAVRGNVTSL